MSTTETTSTKVPITCARCGASSSGRPNKEGQAKLPRGWLRAGEEPVCGKCREAAWMLRSVRVTISGPLCGDDEPIESYRARQHELWLALGAAARDSARLANWLVQRLLAADPLAAMTQDEIDALPRTRGGGPKVPPCPEIDYYRTATARFGALAPKAIVSIAQRVREVYSEERFAALVALSRGVRSYVRHELAVDVPSQAWRIERAGKRWVLRTAIAPGASWRLVVYADAWAAGYLEQLADGRALGRGLQLVRRGVRERETDSREQHGRRKKVWCAQLALLVPRPTRRRQAADREVTLVLGHDAEALWYGHLLEEPGVEYTWRGERLRRLVGQPSHGGEDPLWRRGLARRRQRRWLESHQRRARRRDDRIQAELDTAARDCGLWCRRQGVTSVDYDATDRGYFGGRGPYHLAARRLALALENQGIALHQVGAAPDEKGADD